METQKRTTGRKKPNTVEETVETPVAEVTEVKEVKAKPKAKKKASPKIKQNISENHTSVFEALKNKGPAYMIMTRNVRVYDPETDEVRIACYCPSETSIWKDEQSKNSQTEPIVFRGGYLTVNRNNPNMRKFLELHPGNKANGGSMFGLVDKRADAEEEMAKEFAVHDAVNLIKTSDFNDLLSVALYFKVNIDRKASEIKFDLLKIAKSKPTEFVESFDNPSVKAKAVLRQAADYQLIKIAPDSVKWFDSNSLIVSVPHGQDPLNILTRFCLTERGASVLADLESELEKLA